MDEQQRIEERRFWLLREKRLAEAHKLMADELKLIEGIDEYNVEAPLLSALWALGVALIQVGRYMNPETPRVDPRA